MNDDLEELEHAGLIVQKLTQMGQKPGALLDASRWVLKEASERFSHEWSRCTKSYTFVNQSVTAVMKSLPTDYLDRMESWEFSFEAEQRYQEISMSNGSVMRFPTLGDGGLVVGVAEPKVRNEVPPQYPDAGSWS